MLAKPKPMQQKEVVSVVLLVKQKKILKKLISIN